ncbi:MAG: hypothetical protein M1831_007515 [Alyxoria varia]|nr:MAG: hypothetical protein M1831_007515 [Alyxoria varia]
MAALMLFTATILLVSPLFTSGNPTVDSREPRADKGQCRYLPGDEGWPSRTEWSKLNDTVGGKLIGTVPLGSPCHDPTYDAAQCAQLESTWPTPQIHAADPSSMMGAYFQNRTCDPFRPRDSPCTLGNLPAFSINIASAEDVVAGLEFAKKHNTRLIVKNTGHDFLGKSTGRGALSLWTHNLKSAKANDNYKSSCYNGPAIKIGAGVVGSEVYTAADAAGYTAYGGDCPSVGVAGGYAQGGGHGLLTGKYGLAADQVLEWEVVTPKGKHVVAKPGSKYEDLYWALSGGGGGTYGVVLSMTYRMFKDEKFGGANLTYTSAGVSKQDYWDAFTAVQKTIVALNSAGAVSTYSIFPEMFQLASVSLPGKTGDDVEKLLKPFTKKLDSLKIKYQLDSRTDKTYLDHYKHYFGPWPEGFYPVGHLMAGRLIPKTVLSDRPAEISSTFRWLLENTNVSLGMVSFDSSFDGTTKTVKPVAPNAVLPGWRRAGTSVLMYAPIDFASTWEAKYALSEQVSGIAQGKLDQLAGSDAGVYLNEASFKTKDWQKEFYGSNYGRLRGIKKKYDPDDTLWAVTAVGSEEWTLTDSGRLCRGRHTADVFGGN